MEEGEITHGRHGLLWLRRISGTHTPYPTLFRSKYHIFAQNFHFSKKEMPLVVCVLRHPKIFTHVENYIIFEATGVCSIFPRTITTCSTWTFFRTISRNDDDFSLDVVIIVHSNTTCQWRPLRPVPLYRSCGYRAPYRDLWSCALNLTQTAPRFSSRRSSLGLPGIGTRLPAEHPCKRYLSKCHLFPTFRSRSIGASGVKLGTMFTEVPTIENSVHICKMSWWLQNRVAKYKQRTSM